MVLRPFHPLSLAPLAPTGVSMMPLCSTSKAGCVVPRDIAGNPVFTAELGSGRNLSQRVVQDCNERDAVQLRQVVAASAAGAS